MAAMSEKWGHISKDRAASFTTTVTPASLGLRLRGLSMACQEPKLSYHPVKEKKGLGMSTSVSTMSPRVCACARVHTPACMLLFSISLVTEKEGPVHLPFKNHFKDCFKRLSKEE